MAISTINQAGLNAPLTLTSPVLTSPAFSGTPTGTLVSANMPTGSVLQVVNGTTNTETATSSTTYVDSNLTATITPKFSTSKILVIVNQVGVYANSTLAGVKIKLQANGSDILTFSAYTTYYVVNDIGAVSCSYLDSPATTSAVTYKTQFARQTGSGSAVYVQNGGASRSTITLMEIAG